MQKLRRQRLTGSGRGSGNRTPASFVIGLNGGGTVYDDCCFGVDAAGKLSDDRYMVFYNQTQSPGRKIVFSAKGKGA